MFNTIRQNARTIWDFCWPTTFKRGEGPLEAGEFEVFNYRRPWLPPREARLCFACLLVTVPFLKNLERFGSVTPFSWIDYWMSHLPLLGYLSLLLAWNIVSNWWRTHLTHVAAAHYNDIIEVDRNTIRWKRGGQMVLALWEDVHSVSYEQGPRWREHHGVLTIQANTGTFTIVPAAVERGDELMSIIRAHAPRQAWADDNLSSSAPATPLLA